MSPFRRRGERQKRRRRRRDERRTAGVTGGLGAARTALLKGVEATARRARWAQPPLARVAALGARLLRSVATTALRVAAGIDRLLRGAIGFLATVISGATTRLSRILTPERAVFGVTVAAAACLVVSQFSDYRGVEIDRSAYADVADIVRAPQVDVERPIDAHSILLIPVALIAAGLAALALRTRRWQLGRIVGLAGLAAVAVVLLVDMPKGLDEGSVATRYNGAQAVLGEGFYAELVASAVLVFCGLLIALTLRRAPRPAGRRRRARRPRPRSGEAPSLARSGT